MPSTTRPALRQVAPRASTSLLEVVEGLLRVAGNPGQEAFLARAVRALTLAAGQMDTRSLADATGARSDFQTLLLALRGILEQESERDPLAAARVRGVQQRRELLEESGSLSVQEVARHLGLTRQAVDKRRRAGKLLAVQLGRRGYAYPAWQLEPRGTLEGLERLLEALRGHDEWMQLSFVLSGDPRLEGETPLAVLRAGRVEETLQAARAWGEQGGS